MKLTINGFIEYIPVMLALDYEEPQKDHILGYSPYSSLKSLITWLLKSGYRYSQEKKAQYPALYNRCIGLLPNMGKA